MSLLGLIILVAVAAAFAGAVPGVIGALAGKRLTKEQQGFLPAVGVAIALAIVIPAGLQLRQPPIEWVSFASSDGGFRALFPTLPQPGSVTAGPAEHPVTVQQFVAHWENPSSPATSSLDCVIAYIDYPKAELGGVKPEKVLESARDGAAKQGKGTVTEDTDLTVTDYPAKLIKIEQSQAWVYTLLILAKERLYVVTVATPAGVPRPAAVTTFFESFAVER